MGHRKLRCCPHSNHPCRSLFIFLYFSPPFTILLLIPFPYSSFPPHHLFSPINPINAHLLLVLHFQVVLFSSLSVTLFTPLPCHFLIFAPSPPLTLTESILVHTLHLSLFLTPSHHTLTHTLSLSLTFRISLFFAHPNHSLTPLPCPQCFKSLCISHLPRPSFALHFPSHSVSLSPHPPFPLLSLFILITVLTI